MSNPQNVLTYFESLRESEVEVYEQVVQAKEEYYQAKAHAQLVIASAKLFDSPGVVATAAKAMAVREDAAIRYGRAIGSLVRLVLDREPSGRR